MLLSIHFVSTVLIVLSTVNASPPQQYPDSTTYPGYRICTTRQAKPATEMAPRTATPGMRNPFQAFPGKPFKCETCCGWEALANGNIVPSNCTVSAKPNSYKNSGSGCTADKKNCVHALTCAQNPTTGACLPNTATLTGIGLYTLGIEATNLLRIIHQVPD
ncbi:hypothetical protein B0H14DRAFT_3144585 [Mycena olivaceomarginata]|nr:hypothetical protein B0H14DRAFT_3144585 [Mycena olivaceomarginata]